MKKRGFTLIELLAVIVILAIIALIAVPIVMNVIENTRKGSTERSAENYLKAVETAVATERIDNKILDGIYKIKSNGNLCPSGQTCTDETEIKIDMSGNKPKSGIIVIENGQVVGTSSNGQKTTIITNDDYIVSYNTNGKLESAIKVWTWEDKNDNDLADIGDMISIGTDKPQRFYIYGNDGTNIKAFAEYNLLVGNEVDSNNNATPLSNPTGLQDSTAKGVTNRADNTKGEWYGTTAFSSDEQKGTNYSSYEGSIVEEYVNEYKTKLINDYKANRDIQARLITYAELTDKDTFNCREYGVCSTAYPWAYSTTYWTGSPKDEKNVWYIIDNKGEAFFYKYGYNYDNLFGVRPVIIISASEI